MKKIYTLLFSLVITGLGFAQTNIYTQTFENDGVGYTSSATEGSTFIDVFNRIDASTAPGGNIGGNSTFVWAIEDSNVTPGTVTLSQMDVTGFSDFTFSIDMIAHHYLDWDSTDELLITYSVDGAIFENLLSVQDIDAADAFNTPAALDTDFDGEGECGAGTTLPSLITGTSNGCTVANNQFETFSSSTITLNGNTTLDIVLTFNNLSGTDEGLYLDNISVDGMSGGTASTEVNFIGASATIGEDAGFYELEFTIANEDAINATSFDVVMTSGDAADIDNYTTQVVTFAAGSIADETLELTITDDGTFEADETITFEIQNVTGGATAVIGANNTFDLTITNNDPPGIIGLPYTEDFSDCATAAWIPFSENTPADDVWTCDAVNEYYSMNGFGDEDDIDWLISSFRIDFDAQTNENIAVTTSERFGDAINDAGEFELRYSTDYAGFGDPTGATWTALTFNPNNTSTGATASPDSIASVDASGITGVAYLAFVYDMTAGSGAEEWRITDVLVQAGALPTSVEFIGTTANVAEDSGTYDLEFTITNEDPTNATTFDVVLTVGDAADIDSYTTQLVTFPAGSVIDQTVTITITDDILEELDETLTFEIQNVAGGNAAAVGTNSSFDLTILENDEAVIPGTLYDADFSNDGDGFAAHSSGSPPVAGPIAVGPFGTAPNAWSLSYDTAPNTDASDNTFEVASGELQSNDWGGQGIYTSQIIDVTGISVVDITATGVNAGANENNFTYFYIIDGGTRVETPVASINGDPVNYSVLGLNVTGATDLEVGYEFSENGGNQGYNISEVLVIEGSTDTSVQFASSSDSVFEGVGSYDLTFEILFEDAINDTTFDVVLTSGDAADINTYTTQLVTFSGGDATNQTVTVTITDDMVEELTEVFTFEIQNVAGGDNAVVGINNTFDLTILDDDGFVPMPGDIVISEIMYNSLGGDDEWIEIYNASGDDITLDADWRLNYHSSTYDFTGIVITNNSYLTVALGSNGDGTYNNDNPFTPDASAIATPVATTNDGNKLVNSTATIELIYQPSGANTTIDTVTYDDGAPWPTAADGNGPSLELIDLTFDNTLGASWVASGFYDGGTPGSEYVAPITYTFSGTWSPSDPNGTATAGDDIVIASGDATINANTTCNSVTVNPGAGLTVDTGVALTATNGLTLESTSTSYSSLILDGTVTGTLRYDRHVNINGTGSTGSNDLLSAPLTGQAFNTFAAINPNILNNGTVFLFGPFEKVSGTFVNYEATETATLDAGVGYRSGTSDNSSVTFFGAAENGIITNDIINAGTNNAEWNLVGNPYPSYLNVQQFLNHDVGGVINIQLFDAPTAAIYGYDGSALNGWTVYNLANTTASTVIAPGQGFFVSADATNAPIYDLEFTPAMRSTGTGDDFIAGRNSELIFVKLKASTNANSFTTDLYFNNNSSLGLDVGYDAKIWGDTTPDFALYSHLAENNTGEAMSIQSLNSTDISNISIPLGVNANQGEQLTFSIADMNIPATVKVYLEDVEANTVTLLNNSDYVFTPATAISGTGRFFLRTSNSALSTIDNSLDNLNIFAINASKELVVTGELKENTVLNLYDIQGRNVLSVQLDNKNLENRIDISSLSAGVYVVNINNNKQQKSQKVIIN